MSKSKTSLSAQIVSTTSPAAGKNVLSELYEPMKKAEFGINRLSPGRASDSANNGRLVCPKSNKDLHFYILHCMQSTAFK